MKQAILVRMDLKLPKGKLAAQVAHAAVQAALTSERVAVNEWLSDGAKKVVLKVKDEKEIREFLKKAQNAGIKTALITDAGHTVVAPGTVTTLGIGPDDDKKIDVLVGHLKLM